MFTKSKKITFPSPVNRLNDSIVVYLRSQGREETDKDAVTQNHLSGI